MGVRMKSLKLITLLSLLFSSNIIMAKTTLECNQKFGNSVYSTFTLELDDYSASWDDYDLSDLVGTNVTLDGVTNENHVDNDDLGEGWTFVTLGKRT